MANCWGVWSLLVANLYQYWFPTHFSVAIENCFEQGPLLRSNFETDVNIALRFNLRSIMTTANYAHINIRGKGKNRIYCLMYGIMRKPLSIVYEKVRRKAGCTTKDQMINDHVNAHLISGPRISTKHTKPGKNKVKNDLDLQYSLNFIYYISCLHVPSFRSQAAIPGLLYFLKNPLVSLFPIEMQM